MGNEIRQDYINRKIEIADFIYGNDDKKIDASEKDAISLFLQAVEEDYKKGSLNKATYDYAKGLYTTDVLEKTDVKKNNEVKKEEDVKEDNKLGSEKADEKNLSKSDKKDLNKNRDDVKKDIENRSKKFQSIEELKTYLVKAYPNEKYAPVLAEVQEIIDLVKNEEHDSKEDIGKIKGNVKKDNKNLTGFQKNILDDVVKIVKTEQIIKEYKDLRNLYNAELAKDKSDTPNYKQAYENVKEAVNDDKKYDKTYKKEALKLLEQHVKDDVAHDVDFNKRRNLKSTKDNDVKKELKALYDEDDKFSQKYIDKDKADNKLTARRNKFLKRAEELKSIPLSEIKEVLGEDLYRKLEAKNFFESRKNADGSYNLYDISKAVEERAGLNYWVDPNSDDPEMSEFVNTQGELGSISGLGVYDKKNNKRGITEDETDKFLKLTEMPKRPKDRNVFNGLKKGLSGIIPGAVGAAISATAIDIKQTMRITAESSIAQELISQMQAAGYNPQVSEGNSGELSITATQRYVRDFRALSILSGAALGVLQGTLLHCILGEEVNETSCISIADFVITDEKYNNIDKYEEYIRQKFSNNPDKADNIVSLARTFVKPMKDGKIVENYDQEGTVPYFDAAAYDTYLKKAAGIGSPLNCQELHSSIIYQEKPEVKTVTKKEPVKNEPVIKTEEDAIKTVKNAPSQGELKTVPFKWGRESWMSVIATFYPEAVKEQDLEELSRVFRKSHGIKLTSGIPTGQTLHLGELKIGGKTYKPVTSDYEETLKSNNTKDKWGWTSRYYVNPNWNKPIKGSSKVTSKEQRGEDKVTYTSTRQSDKATKTGADEKTTQDGLVKKPQKGVKVEYTIKNSDGTTRKVVVEEEK